MTVKRRLLVGISLLILTGMRDPFQPPEDRCHITELSTWRYQGAVSRGGRLIGLVQDGEHTWRRIELYEVLKGGWTVSHISAQSITIEMGKDCEPSRWQWQRQGQGEGEGNESMDSRGADGRHPQRAGGKSAKRDAGGG